MIARDQRKGRKDAHMEHLDFRAVQTYRMYKTQSEP
jgi:hypothetical protein